MASFILTIGVGFCFGFFFDDIKKEVNKFINIRKRLQDDE